MDKLFLLDAYALIYRSYYAFIKNPRINSKGLNTSAVMGFCNTLHEVLQKEQPTYLGVAFDPHGPTFRNEAYEQYKAQREETPGEDDPRAELVDMLLEYQRFRQATAFFREKGEEGADMLTKAPEPLGDAPREVHGVPNDLVRAANRLLRRVRDFAAVQKQDPVSREMVAIPHGGYVVDRPGVRGLGLWDADAGIGVAFADVEELAEQCRFRN